MMRIATHVSSTLVMFLIDVKQQGFKGHCTITCVNHLKSGCIAIYISMHKLTCYK